jgi:hypothetical protein
MLCSNPKVVAYYKRNPHLDFDALNAVLVDLLEKVGDDMGRLVQTNLKEELRDLRQEVADLRTHIPVKLAEANGAFLETVKMLLSIDSSEQFEKVGALLARQVESFGDRLQILFPKFSEDGSRRLGEHVAVLQRTLQLDLKEALGDQRNLPHFLENFDRRLATLQQPLQTLLEKTAKEDRLHGDLSEFLQKYAASPQLKGRLSEDQLSAVLCDLYPTAEVRNTTGLTAHGDFLLVREGKSKILFENKNYQRNVESSEVDKFIRDAAQQKRHAVMLSQFTGIASKPNFFIEVNDGCVLIYLHNVRYNPELIRLAVDVIDNLALKLEGEDAEGVQLSKETLEQINGELQQFAKKKEAMASMIKDQQRSLLAQLDDMHLPGLFKLIGQLYTSPQTQAYVCPVCSQAFSTKRGLGLHKRVHS